MSFNISHVKINYLPKTVFAPAVLQNAEVNKLKVGFLSGVTPAWRRPPERPLGTKFK